MNPTLYGDLERRRAPGIWTVLNRLLIGGILLAVCAGGILAFIPLIGQRADTARRIETLRTAIAHEKALLSRNTREVEMLQNNPEYVETIARDKLNLMKPGEMIIRLEPDQPPAAAALPSPALAPVVGAAGR